MRSRLLNVLRIRLAALRRPRDIWDRFIGERFDRFIRERFDRFIRERGYPVIVRLSVRHVHGPRRIEYGLDEVLAISVVRHGELHIRSFLDHHFALGVKHIVLLLNDSTDATAAVAATYRNVTILRCDVPYQRYENTMKYYLAHRFSRGRWNLCVDIDELFDYPYSSDVPLRSVLAYLNEQGYTAVIAQMLDMFAGGPLSQVHSQPGDQMREAYPFYDISAIRKVDYYSTPGLHFSHRTAPDIMFHFGGIRRQVFGTENGLTKAALVKLEPDIEMFVGAHHVNNATLADFTCVLLHYPFVESFTAKVADAVATGRYGPFTSEQYEEYWEKISQDKAIVFRKDSACRLGALSELFDNGFLVCGPQFAEWCAARLGVAVGR